MANSDEINEFLKEENFNLDLLIILADLNINSELI
jgi:hypothetical protein